MSFILTNLVVLVVAACGFWWLSGYDSRVTGENPRLDFAGRALRCGIALLFVEVAFYHLWQYRQHGDRVAGIIYLACTLPLALIWAGCVSEMLARGVHRLIDPEDDREFDPGAHVRELDRIADLIRSGRKDEAIQQCEKLKTTGEISPSVLEMTLEYLGVPQKNSRLLKPLTEADRLKSEGRFREAELILTSLMMKDPRDVETAMMLMRLYAQDMHRPEKAGEVLRLLEKQPHVSPAYFEFARRSISEWNRPAPKKTVVEAQPESIDEMLARGYFGTVIENLEQKIAEQPQDFDLRLKLAEVYAIHCGDLSRAEKIGREIDTLGHFSPEQVQHARTRIREWREARKRAGH